MEQFTNTEELLRRIRENVPEILGGESNPDMEDEVEQIMCVVESAPRVAPEGGCARWRTSHGENGPSSLSYMILFRQTSVCTMESRFIHSGF